MTTLQMSSNWVDGDRFFDREVEMQLLRERVENGTHTLLTAQRRMGKTSLVDQHHCYDGWNAGVCGSCPHSPNTSWQKPFTKQLIITKILVY